MKEFKKWWDKVSMEDDWDYEHYAVIGWERALEWVLSLKQTPESVAILVEPVEKELED